MDKQFYALMYEYINANNLTYGGKVFQRKAILIVSLAFVSYFFILFAAHFVPAWMMLVSVGVLTFAKAEIGLSVMHDANHGAASKHKWVNDLWSKTLNLVDLYWPNWREKHNVRHHSQTNVIHEDEDIDVAPFLLRFSKYKPYFALHRWQYLYVWPLYGLQTFQWMYFGDFAMAWRYSEGQPMEDRLLCIVKVVRLKVIYLFFMIVLPALVTPYSLGTIIIVFCCIHFVIGFVTAVVFQLAHVVEKATMHQERSDSFVLHQFATTADFAPNNPLVTWLVGGLNYQVVHHLFPKISHVHYDKIVVKMREVVEELGITYHVYPTVWAAVKAHAAQMKQLGHPNGLCVFFT